jgi:hypothetical protein
MKNPIIIVGMARSGTTLVSHIFGSLKQVHIEVEPHALWKSGNFKYLNDEQYDSDEKIIARIKNKFLKKLANDKVLVEKSPINSLRPHLVHKVFPNAKIIYIERNSVRCIYSNYCRSLKKDSFKLSIILKKYFLFTGSKDLEGAISNRSLFQQISLKDLPIFIKYSFKMMQLRNINNYLPFGPKLKNFLSVVKDKGLLHYHVEVYKKSNEYKKIYKELFGEQMKVFSMEKIMSDEAEIIKMMNFSELEFSKDWISEIQKTLDSNRILNAMKKSDFDEEIIKLLSN